MSGNLWDPFAVLDRLDREFDAIVRASFGNWDRPRARRGGLVPVLARAIASPGNVVPPVDVVTDGDDMLINVELPGVDVEKDVTVEVERGRLVVRGERGHESESTENGRTYRERWHGSFRREFALPDGVRADEVTARYDKGVLSIRLPGAAAVQRGTRIPVTAEPAPAELPSTEAGTAKAKAEATEATEQAAA